MLKDSTSAQWRTVGRYRFEWTKDHIGPEETGKLKCECDTLGSQALPRLQRLATSSAQQSESACRLNLYGVLREHHAEDPVLKEFWQETHRVPEWVDWAQLERGQKFFYRYALANIVGFALQGFMAENSAGTAEVLVRTGGFSIRVLLRRVLETFQWLLQVTKSLDGIKPGGEGHVSTVRVRLLHASVRQRITKLAESKPEYFDAERYGLPVNTLDSIHSIATFCCNPMWLQLPLMGIKPSQQETDDYIALFRYLGHVIGTPQQYFATVEVGKATMESMLLTRQPTEAAKVLTHNFIQCLVDLPPLNISRGFIEAGCRFVNGDEICDALDLQRPGWTSYAQMRGFCWLVQLLALAQRTFHSFDSFMIEVRSHKQARRWRCLQFTVSPVHALLHRCREQVT